MFKTKEHRINKKSLVIMSNVVYALFLMEVQVRFGSKRIGYVWAIIDPMTKVIIFSIIKMLIMNQAIPGLDFPVFLATSFFFYEFFRRTVISYMTAFKANKALSGFKRVRLFDTLLAYILVEFVVTIIAFVIFLGVLFYIGMDISIKDFSMFSIAVLWFTLFTFSIGVFSAVVNSFYPSYAKVVTFVFTPLMFLSALFYTIETIPGRFAAVKEYLLYNPVVHFIEMIHGNYFRVLDTKYVDYTYMFFWTIIPLFLGLYLYQKSEKKILDL